MKPEETRLMYGQTSILEVDPRSDESVNLYLPKDVWKYLVERVGGNKMTVTLRGPYDLSNNITGSRSVISEIFRGAEE